MPALTHPVNAPLNILLAGGGNIKNFAARYYDYANKLANGFIRNGHTVVRFYDRDTARLSNFLRSRKLGRAPANAALIRQVATFKPHILVLMHADVITAETLAEIKHRHPGTHIVQVNIDALFTPENVHRIKTKLPFINATFLTTGGPKLKHLCGDSGFFIPNIIDPGMECYTSFAQNQHDWDVFFACGRAASESGFRRTLPQAIRTKHPEIRLTLRSAEIGTQLWGSAYMQTLGASRMGLNLSRSTTENGTGTPDDLYMYSSDRISHLVGNGVLTFSQRGFLLEALFTEDEMVFFSTEEEFFDKLMFYHTHPTAWRTIAAAGHRRAHSCYTAQLAAAYIADIATTGKPAQTYPWPLR